MSQRARIRKTKIVATFGPASDSPQTLVAMMQAGINVARLNLSHGTFGDHRQRLERIRAPGWSSVAPCARTRA